LRAGLVRPRIVTAYAPCSNVSQSPSRPEAYARESLHHGVKYVLAVGLAALGGTLTAFATGHMGPDMAYWTTSGEFVFIALMGGTAYVAAPYLGSLIFELVKSYAFQVSPYTWQLILGAVLLTIILFLPRGLWSLVAGRGRA
jgi:ABC-type branched-subunit amino acid transport system permease subunit